MSAKVGHGLFSGSGAVARRVAGPSESRRRWDHYNPLRSPATRHWTGASGDAIDPAPVLGNSRGPMEPGPSRTAPRSDGPTPTEIVIDRRRFLVLAGSAAAYVVLRPHLAWARRGPGGRPDPQTWTLPSEPGIGSVETARALIAAAVLAPSHWNTQPWRFEAEGNVVRIVADTQRSLPGIDPDQRSLMMSLGAALENLLVAARGTASRPAVTYFPHNGAGGVVAEVTWTTGESRRDGAMLAAISARRTNRREYDGRGIYLQNRTQLTAQIPEAFHLHWVDDRTTLRKLGDLAHDAVHARISDERAQAEQFSWMRFGDDEARKTGDGVTVDALEIGGPARWLAGRSFNPKSMFLRFGAGNCRQAGARMDALGGGGRAAHGRPRRSVPVGHGRPGVRALRPAGHDARHRPPAGERADRVGADQGRRHARVRRDRRAADTARKARPRQAAAGVGAALGGGGRELQELVALRRRCRSPSSPR